MGLSVRAFANVDMVRQKQFYAKATVYFFSHASPLPSTFSLYSPLRCSSYFPCVSLLVMSQRSSGWSSSARTADRSPPTLSSAVPASQDPESGNRKAFQTILFHRETVTLDHLTKKISRRRLMPENQSHSKDRATQVLLPTHFHQVDAMPLTKRQLIFQIN